MNFKKFHNRETPFLICNVRGVESARTAEKLKFKAIATSSAAIAAVLGYRDGEEMSFEELYYIVKRIAATVKIPLSVDLEAGYSREPAKIAQHIKKLIELGVVGINLEDSLTKPERFLVSGEKFSETISEVKEHLEKERIECFLNIRTDAFLLRHPTPVQETKARIKLYEKAGANGIFVPCIEKEADIQSIVESTELPINVMCMPNLPDFEKLHALGVKRISMGNFLFTNINARFERLLTLIQEKRSFDVVFN